MTRRPITALAVAAFMGLAACGGGDGGSSALSEDDFIDEVNDICADANDELDSLAEPESIDDVADFAADSRDVFETLREDLGDIAPPDDLEGDFGDALDTMDEIIELLTEVETAAEDGDEDGALDLIDEISSLSDDLEGLADDIGVEDCNFADDETTTTEPPAADTTVAETVPPTTGTPITLPATTAPPATPAPTEPPATEAPVPDITADPATGALFSIADLTTIFNPPTGYTMVDTSMDTAIPFIQAVAAVPILNVGIEEMGVAAVIDSFNDPTGTLVVGVALEGFGMPEEWKTLICTPETSEIRTTPAGYTGVYCPGSPGSGLIEVFIITEGDIGVTFALVDPFYTVEEVVDAFLTANF